MTKYTIELSQDQLRLIADCLEDVSRFASGQWTMKNLVEEMVRQTAPADWSRQIDLRDEAEEHLKMAKRVLLPAMPDNGSYGYNGTDFIGNTYQIYRTILHELNKDADSRNVYSSPPLPSGTMGTITITKLLEPNEE